MSAASDEPPTVIKTVELEFRHNGDIPEPAAEIIATGDGGRAPRQSRHIEFVDDGKLFEGHLSVQSRSLKSIIQYLVNNQEEQAVIIRGLQDEVNTMRVRAAKSNRSVGFGRGAAGAGTAEIDAVAQRLKNMENFMMLWGARPQDMSDLVENYGDPVVTPEAYTSYLLDLPSFRLTRREARTLMASSGSQATAARVLSPDSSSRRRGSSSGREEPTAGGGGGEAGRRALEKATEALARIEALERGSGRGGGRRRSPDDDEEEVVDETARRDLEDLGQYVMKRIKELERTAHAATSAASKASAAVESVGEDSAVEDFRRPRPTPRGKPRRTEVVVEDGDEVDDYAARRAAAARPPARPRPRRSDSEGESAAEESMASRRANAASRGRQRKVAIPPSEVVQEQEEEMPPSAAQRRGRPSPPSRTKRAERRTVEVMEDMDDDEEATPPRARPAPSRQKPRRQVEVESEDDAAVPPPGRPSPSRPKARRPVVESEDEEMEEPVAPQRGSRAKPQRQAPAEPEMPSTTARNRRSPARPGKGRSGVDVVETPESRRPPRSNESSTASGRPAPPPLPPAAAAATGKLAEEDLVDNVAREDASAALELVEDLQHDVYKRLKDMASTIQSLQRAVSSRPPSVEPTPVTATPDRQSPDSARNSRGNRLTPDDAGDELVSRGASKRPPRPSSRSNEEHSRDPSPARKAGGSAGGPTIDKVAREEAAAVGERMGELEEDMAKRWQGLEERLRIIGRATMGVPPPNPGGSVDRKAREDASLSLMRVQHLERDLASLRRQLAAIHTAELNRQRTNERSRASSCSSVSEEVVRKVRGGGGQAEVGVGTAASASSSNPGPLPEPGSPLQITDTYSSRVEDLEKEVQQRMADVEAAIALLKGSNQSPQDKSLLAILTSLGAPAAASVGLPQDPYSAAATAAAPSSLPPGLLVVKSVEDADLVDTSGGGNPSAGAGVMLPGGIFLPAAATNTGAADSMAKNLKSAHPVSRPLQEAMQQAREVYLAEQVVRDDFQVHRKTTHRLRSPQGTTFGRRLVERDVLEEILAERHPQTPSTRTESRASGVVHRKSATDMTPNLPEGPPHIEETLADFHPQNSSGGLMSPMHQAQAAPAAAVSGEVSPASNTKRSNMEVPSSAITHTTPCVIVNCVWCQENNKLPEVVAVDSAVA